MLHIAKNIFSKGLSQFNLLFMETEKGESGRKEEKARNISSMVFFILFFKKYIKDRLITEDKRNLRVSGVGLCRM